MGLPAPDAHPNELRARARTLHQISRALLDHFHVERRVLGSVPEAGLLVTNHVSFLDIIFLSAVQPMIFVSKSEVARWPLVGAIANASGTIYVRRNQRSDVNRVNAALRNALDAGLLVTLFPEGTSSDGSRVLPFQPSLLQPAIEHRVPVLPGHLSYTNPNGERADDLAYFGERDLLPCLLALLYRNLTFATVHFAPPHPPAQDRKSLANTLHQTVSALSPFPPQQSIPS